jgi:hypothetical protein
MSWEKLHWEAKTSEFCSIYSLPVARTLGVAPRTLKWVNGNLTTAPKLADRFHHEGIELPLKENHQLPCGSECLTAEESKLVRAG